MRSHGMMTLSAIRAASDRAPSACQRYPERSKASSDPLASRYFRGRTRPRRTLRGELTVQVGVVPPQRAMDGPDGSAAVAHANAKFGKLDMF